MDKKANNILHENSKLMQFNTGQVEEAVSILDKYIALAQNNNRLFKSGINLSLSGEYNDISLKRSTLIDSSAQNTKFINAALTGSYFSQVYFKNSKFDESNLQYCQFIQNNFKQIDIYSTNLSYSNFYNTMFENVVFKGSTVSEILFEDCTFENCKFTSSMLENTIFLCCTFRHVEFVNTNIEYMELKNCKLDDIYLPMSQVPYVFGLFQNLPETENSIKLGTDKRTISLEEYKNLKESLIIYYTSISEYFPLANIYLADFELDNAYECIRMGMQQSIIQRNFRMLKFFCKQAKQGNFFDYDKLKSLYVVIEKYIKTQSLNIYEQRSFIHNIGEIRSTLLDNIDGFPTVCITLQTNIDSSEIKKIMQFIDYIDTTIEQICEQKVSHIEYRHNSDASFVAFISAHYTEILLTVYTFLTFSNNTINSVQEKIINHQKIILNRLEIEEKRKSLKDAEKKKEELQNSGINYTVKYIIDSHDEDSHDINIYL